MRLIHCADLHLDSGMKSLPDNIAEERHNELLDTWSRLVTDAIDRNVRAVILAGDIFDGERVSNKTLRFFLSEIQRAPQIDFLYLSGNHDEGGVFRDYELPPNLKLFGDKWACYAYDNVCIYGVSQTRQNYSLRISHELAKINFDPNQINIVVLHGAMASGAGGYNTINTSWFSGKPISYFALGHIHQYKRWEQRGSIWCYPGCLEGRGFDERGPKGYVLLDVGTHSLRDSFVPFSQRTFEEVSVDISDLRTTSGIRDALRKESSAIPVESLVKFVLYGTHDIDSFVDTSLLATEISSWFYFSKIKDDTKLSIDSSEYARDISLKGEFLRVVQASGLSDKEKARTIKVGLSAIAGEAIKL